MKDEVQEIERDLARWPRGKWAAAIVILFAVQLGVLIWSSQRQVVSRASYPNEPKVTFALGANALSREWLEMENPFLFAAASQNGFSGEAWLRQPKWEPPELRRRVAPNYLQDAEAQKLIPRQQGNQAFAFVQRHRASAILPQPPEAPIAAPASDLRVSGFGGRMLAAPIELPLQYHGDVLAASVVEGMIDGDGFVISARLIENSGSTKADADALALARRARFVPDKGPGNALDSGKLIFEWFALNLGDTNNVKR